MTLRLLEAKAEQIRRARERERKVRRTYNQVTSDGGRDLANTHGDSGVLATDFELKEDEGRMERMSKS